MNAIATYFNTVIENFRLFAGNEVFRNETLLAAGAQPKNSPAEKAALSGKLGRLDAKLGALETWMENSPKVETVVTILQLLAECVALYEILSEILESCDFPDFYLDESGEAHPETTNDAEGKQIKINNAISRIASLFGFDFLKRKSPTLWAAAEATGILSDEWNEVKRALYLVSTIDWFRPTGDPDADVRKRIAKAIFLDSSVTMMFLGKLIGLFRLFKGRSREKFDFFDALQYAGKQLETGAKKEKAGTPSKADIIAGLLQSIEKDVQDGEISEKVAKMAGDIIRSIGTETIKKRLEFVEAYYDYMKSDSIDSMVDDFGLLLFNFGWELPLEKDNFKNANQVAGRVLQAQYVPGDYLEDVLNGKLDDLFISFATIPVGSPTVDGNTPFQYLLKIESAIENFSPNPEKMGGFRLSIPARPNFSMIWGHETDFKFFSGDHFGAGQAFEMFIPRGSDGQESTPAKSSRDAAAPPGTAASKQTGPFRRGDISFAMKAVETDGKEALDLRLEFKDFSLVLSGDGRDGFIQKILPDGALHIDAGFIVGFNTTSGFYLEGIDDRDGLFFQFKVDKSLFGAVTISTLYVGLRPALEKDENGNDELSGVTLETSAMIKTKFGPFRAMVDRLGLFLTLDFPKDGGGNLGGANLDLGLKPPSGIGFLVDAKVVKGGGFLSIDREKGQYFGAAELTLFEEYSIKAVAVILTKRPDGSKGYSFLLIVSVEFNPPWDLFMGIRLKGLGGLVGTHRSIDLNAFREGIRDDRFDAILFPDDPVGNAPTIVSTMTTLFPFAEGRYAFGFLGRLEWGTSKLVDMKIGILVEVPNPVKIAIVGTVKMTVEKGDLQVLKFKLNFLIAIDFGKKIFSVDAALYDSTFVKTVVQGEFYLRVTWGEQPFSLASVGGWHPAIQPPAQLNLPAKPKRLGVMLMNSDRIKLGFEFYVALMSNSFQIGAALELKVKVSKFRLEAGLSLDALFRSLSDFQVDFSGKLLIFWGDNRLAGITVQGALFGTEPWRIKGSATFSIWIWDYDVDFDVSSGPETGEIQQSLEVLPALENAVRDQRNWRITLPPGRPLHVVHRSAEEEPSEQDANQALMADPVARIEIVQQVTPLGIRIDKVGFERAKGFRKFDLAPADDSIRGPENDVVADFFAPGMFLDLSDAEKLSRKSFESMPAGRIFSDFDTVTTGIACQDGLEYEDTFRDTLAPPPKETNQPLRPLPHTNAVLVANGSVARSEQGRKNQRKAEINQRKAPAANETFVLIDALTGQKLDTGVQKSMSAAYYEQWKLHQENALRKIVVVSRFDTP